MSRPVELPPQPSARQLFTAFHSRAQRWSGVLRAALALPLPGAVALLTEHGSEMLPIAAGGCMAIYGEGHPHRSRLRVMSIAGLCLIAGVMSGSFVGSMAHNEIASDGSNLWLLLIALFTTILATIGAFIQDALYLSPPGSFFIVIVSDGTTMVARLGFNPIETAMWAAVGVFSAIVIGMAPRLWNPHGPEMAAVQSPESAIEATEKSDSMSFAIHHQARTAFTDAWESLADTGIIRSSKIVKPSRTELVNRAIAAHQRLIAIRGRLGVHGSAVDIVDTPNLFDETQTTIPLTRLSVSYRISRSFGRYSHASMTVIKVAITGGLAGFISVLVGLDRPDRAAVSALMTLQWGPDRTVGSIRGIHRMVGSVIGIFLYMLLFSFGLDSWTLLIAPAACQFGAEVLVVKNYALTTIVTTSLALLLGGSVAGELAPTVTDRVLEVGIACALALAALHFWLTENIEKHYLRHIPRCYRRMDALLGALLTGIPSQALDIRRDLRYKLLSERQAISSLATNNPETAAPYWDGHNRIRTAGHLLLDYCRTRPDIRPSHEEISKLTEVVQAAKSEEY